MEADIYPRQCVTGSAKSAMMNVLAGINPQCTPPPPSSSAVPPPPAATTSLDSPRTPLRHLSRPLTIRFKAISEKTAGDRPEEGGEGGGRRRRGETGIAAGPAPSKGFHGESVRYKHVGVFRGIQIRCPRASYP
ncbi:hypothetical protein X777_08704 [Ooceraea biroi]|uniref:Uncharacterized protein n=1 Tax=Ooceraea biroi TaxID=2015173 RepID=A0A026W964_OOCBI|nr:hypothetical protein X777_08704 [Ooceraea biroi]